MSEISRGLVAVAWRYVSPLGTVRKLQERKPCLDSPEEHHWTPLVRLSDAEAIIAAKGAEIERLKSMLPDIPKAERECKTLEDWRFRALYFESEYAACSHGFNSHASKQAERIKELEEKLYYSELAATSEANEVDRRSERIKELEAEILEQCRINGMGAERELHLLAQVAAKDAEIGRLNGECDRLAKAASKNYRDNGLPINEEFYKQSERIKELESDADEEAHIRDRMAKLLAETAVALKGPEKALHRHGWQDLPDVAAKQSAALKLAKDAFSAIDTEAKEFRSYENARNNFSYSVNERRAYERAMINASELTKKALAAIDALKGE